MTKPTSGVTPFLMFFGQAEEAVNFYTSLFEPASIVHLERYGPDGAGVEGQVLLATFSIKGQSVMAIDSSIKHEFTFTPAISLYVTCDSEDETDRLFAKLSEGGAVLMPLGVYPFSRKFGWVQDRYGVTWQLNLPHR